LTYSFVMGFDEIRIRRNEKASIDLKFPVLVNMFLFYSYIYFVIKYAERQK